MYSRRDFIRLSSLAAAGGVALAGGFNVFGQKGTDLFPIPADALSDRAFSFNSQTFEPLLNSTFAVDLMDGRTASLRLVEVLPKEGKKTVWERIPTDGFSLIFQNSGRGRLEDKIYSVSHPELGNFPLFVSTVGRSGRRYQAVFSRVYV